MKRALILFLVTLAAYALTAVQFVEVYAQIYRVKLPIQYVGWEKFLKENAACLEACGIEMLTKTAPIIPPQL